MSTLKDILPTLLATITRTPRTEVKVGRDFEWSDNSWVHNFFRRYELIFGRRFGIRCELTSDSISRTQQPHTFEAACALLEVYLRELLTFKFPQVSIVRAPALITPQGVLFPSAYSFAIAFDAGSNNVPPTNTSWSHTCTGSNRILFCTGRAPTTDPTAISYNSGALTKTRNSLSFDSGFCFHWYRIAPDASGALTIAITGPTNPSAVGLSYTGALQSGVPDASNTASVSGANALAVTVTTVLDNCWVVGSATDTNGAGVTSAGANTTLRATVNNSMKGYDNGGPQTPAGAVTLNVSDTSSAANLGWIAASFPPAAATGPANVKTVDGLAVASVKTWNGLTWASVKTWDGLA